MILIKHGLSSQWGAIISNLEWITYVCNHSHGSEWKEKAKQDSVIQTPLYVTKVMAKGTA